MGVYEEMELEFNVDEMNITCYGKEWIREWMNGIFLFKKNPLYENETRMRLFRWQMEMEWKGREREVELQRRKDYTHASFVWFSWHIYPI